MKGRVAVTFVCFRLSKTFVPKLEYGNLSKFFAGMPIPYLIIRN